MAKTIKFNVKLAVDGKEQLVTATTSVKDLQKAIQGSKGSLDSFLTGVNQWGFAFRNVNSAISEVSGALNTLTEENRAFAKSMAEANTMAGKSAEDFAKLKSQVSDLSREVPIARDALAKGLYQVISNGVPEDSWLDYLEKSSKASVGGLADLEEVVKVTSTVIKNYALDWNAAQEIQDKIQLTAKNGVTSFEQLAQALPRVTANAATLGISVDELMASFATLTGVSGNTAEVSTQLAAIMTALIKPSSEAAKIAQDMGIQFDAAAIKAAGGFQQFLTQLDASIKSYAKSSGMLETEVYGKLFGSAESLRALTPLTGNLADKFAENVESMKDSAGTIDGAFDTMASTGSAKMQMLQNALGDFTDCFSGAIAGVQQFVNAMALLGNATLPIITLTMALQKMNILQTVLSASVVRTSIAYLAFGTNIKKVSAAMTVLANCTRSAATAAVAAKVAIRGMLVATGVGAAIAALTYFLGALIDKLDTAENETKELTAEQQKQIALSQRHAEQQKQLGEAVGNLVGKFQALQAQWKALKTEGDKTSFIKQNQSAFKELGLHINNVNDAYRMFVANAPKVIAALTSIAEAEALQDMYKESYKDYTKNWLMRSKSRQTGDYYNTAKAGDSMRTDAASKAEYEAAGVQGKLIEGYNYRTKEKTYSSVLSDDDAKRLNAYRSQQATIKNNELKSSFEGPLEELRKRMVEAQGKAADAQKYLAGGVKSDAGGSGSATSTGSSSGKNVPPAIKGSIDWYEERMKAVQAKITATNDKATAQKYKELYEKYADELKSLKVDWGLEEPEGIKKGAQEIFKGAVIGAFNEAPGEMNRETLIPGKETHDNAASMIEQIKEELEINLIGADEAQEKIDKINEVLKELGLEPIDIKVNAKGVSKDFKNAAGAVDQLGAAFSQIGSSFELPELNAAGVVAQALAQVALGYANASAQAAKEGGPWVWIAFAISGLTTMLTMMSSITSATSGYATGGVIGGASTFGDKKFARVNSGEMILNKFQQASLFSLINSGMQVATPSVALPSYQPAVLDVAALSSQLRTPSDGTANVRFRISGRDLVGSVANTTQLAAKSGKKSNIKL